MHKPEILSPVGDAACLQAALRYGADAVYLAGQAFGMRTACDNFTEEGLRAAVAQAHAAGVPVYVTCNTLPRNDEITRLPSYLDFLQEAGVDAVIVADVGVLALAKKYAPRCAVHISTQWGVVNYETARQLHEMGAARVVLARELSLAEIAEIRAKTPPTLELEAFVHGAMCMSVSGRCLLSNYLLDRDANRGACAQPCRWKYTVVDAERPERRMDAEQTEGETFLYNAYDLKMLPHMAALAQAGVDSCKIEGRAKAAYYVAAVTNAYRLAADGYERSGCDPDYVPPQWLDEELDKVSHRPYGTGFYFGQPRQCYESGGYLRHWQVVAVVEDWKDGRVYASQRNCFWAGDQLEALRPGQPPLRLTADDLRDGDGGAIDSTPHATMALSMACPTPLPRGSFLRKPLDP